MNFKATGAFHAPTFNCPNCNHEIKLTESLAAPLIEENRKRFQEQLASKDAEIAKKTEALRKEQAELAIDREQIEDQVKTMSEKKLLDGDMSLQRNDGGVLNSANHGRTGRGRFHRPGISDAGVSFAN